MTDGTNGVMILTDFDKWCKSQPNIELVKESLFGDIFDLAGIDAIIKFNGEIKPIQFRIRTTSRYSDVTIRRQSGNTKDRSYKIGNVPLFIYITPAWWVILDTLFYREIEPSGIETNNDGTDFYTYSIDVLKPYIVSTNYQLEKRITQLEEFV